jgi:FKBP-type peptidyl-prolyl cis-trans isomerase
VANRKAPKRRRAPLGQKQQKSLWVRVGVITLVVVVALSFVAVLIVGNDTSDSSSDVSTKSTTTTTGAPAMASAAGKPCVAVADPLPAGAPTVPVKVGPPPTELVKEDLQAGTGAEVAPGATVTVDYIGVACSTGKVFDSSYSRGQPATFPLSGVIPGWQNGIPGMKVGGVRLLGIPPADAYGSTGSPPDIAPDETLWFVVTVKDAQPAS